MARPASTRTDPAVMRELNRGLVLGIVKGEGPLSRADIAKRSQLAKPTVSAIVDGLLTEGVLVEIGVGPAGKGGGRHPILLEFNARSRFAVGVQVAAGTAKALLADALGKEVARDETTIPHGDPDAALRAVADLVDQLVRGARVARKRVAAVGVAMPGKLDTRSGTSYGSAQLGWGEVPAAEILGGSLGLPIHVRNVAQCVVLAEYREGAAKDAASAVVLLEDGGISAALLSDGELFQGTQGIAGDIGHIRLHGVTTPCTCGGRGCLEAVASGIGLAQRAAEATGTPAAGAEGIFARLGVSDDPLVDGLLGEVGAELGVAASWLLNLYDPDVLVLAGGFLDAGEALLEPLRTTALEPAAGQPGATVRIIDAALGADAALRGAVLVALQEAERASR
jgi:predicted NBD/HSP70 family sugar kinase